MIVRVMVVYRCYLAVYHVRIWGTALALIRRFKTFPLVYKFKRQVG